MKLQAIATVISLITNNINSKYTSMNINTIKSLIKNFLFTSTEPFTPAFVTKKMTTVVMKSDEPNNGLIELIALSSPDEIDEKTSGAPFPKARRVTPASDSGILNFTVINSSAGDKYSSAVVLMRYIKTKNMKH